MCRALTPRQRQVLDYVERYHQERGYAPTLEEIRAHLGLNSVATVHKHLKALESKGAVRRLSNRSRAVELAGVGSPRAPLLGTLTAGQPIEAVSAPESIDVPSYLLRDGDTYVLRARGDSIIEEHIMDGDLVVVEARRTVRQGELVVALVDKEAVLVKRYYLTGRFVRLESPHSKASPLIFTADRVQVQGVITGLIRSY